MQKRQLRLSKGVDNAPVIGAAVALIFRDGAKAAFRVEDADQRSRCPDFLNLPDVIKRRFRDCIKRGVPFLWMCLLKRSNLPDDFGLQFIGIWFAGKLRLRLKENHGRHIRAINRIDEIGIAAQTVAHKFQCCKLIRKGHRQGFQLVPFAGC